MWLSKTRTINVADTAAHAPKPGQVGVDVAPVTLEFTAQELFGAAARCSFLTYVDPDLRGREAEMIWALAWPHITSAEEGGEVLAIDKSAADLKDFLKSYFSGVLATGLAYHFMVGQGYKWVGHFENGGAAIKKEKSPDFIFEGDHVDGLALLESKGTRSPNGKQFAGVVKKGYVEQVGAQLAKPIFGGIATHGFCVGARLSGKDGACLIVHHTGPAGPDGTGGDEKLSPAASVGGAGGLSPVQQENYATAFELALGAGMGRMVRTGGEDSAPLQGPFAVRSWLGRRWLVAERQRVLRIPQGAGEADEIFDILSRKSINPMSWAVELEVAEMLLRRLRGRDFEHAERRLETSASRQAARQAEGAVFPDGLALVSGSEGLRTDSVRWDEQEQRFVLNI